MMPTSYVPSSEELTLLDQILRKVARARHLSPQDAQDFVQSVHVKMLERQYDVFTRFAGRSSLRTYLVVVITRMLSDWRNSTRGKWRPAAVAVRLGPHAVLLDRLMHRDGLTADEAIEVARGGREAPAPSELRRIVDLLPRRLPTRHVTDEALRDRSGGFADSIEEREQQHRRSHAGRLLALALRQLPSEDRWLLRERYVRRSSVRAIAETLGADEKQLYRRFDRVLRSLRSALESNGVTESAVGPA